MIDAVRQRANTHAPPARGCLDSPVRNSSSFLGLPPPYGGFLLPNGMHQGTKGFLTCFFWCGHTEGMDSVLEEEEEDLSVGMPDVSRKFILFPPSCMSVAVGMDSLAAHLTVLTVRLPFVLSVCMVVSCLHSR